MGKAWGWPKSTVDRFIDVLKKRDMIETDTGTGILVITICNYDRYQRVSLPAGQKRDTDGTAAGQQRDKREDIQNIQLSEEEIGKPISIAQSAPELSPDPSPAAPSPNTLRHPQNSASLGKHLDGIEPDFLLTPPEKVGTTPNVNSRKSRKVPSGEHPMFAGFWSNDYPKRAGTPGSRADASARFTEIVNSGVPPDDIIAGVRRYAKQMAHFGKIGTESIRQAVNWLKPSERNWEQPYDIPSNPVHSPNSGFRSRRDEPVGNLRVDSAFTIGSFRDARERQASDFGGPVIDGNDDPDRWRTELAGTNVIDATDYIRDQRSVRSSFAQVFAETEREGSEARTGDVARGSYQY
jgi:hypothetical protein